MYFPPGIAYARLRVITWATNGLICLNQLQSNSGQSIASLIQSFHPKSPLVINCRGVYKADDHALEMVTPILRQCRRSIIFTEVRDTLHYDFLAMLDVQPIVSPSGSNHFVLEYGPRLGRREQKLLSRLPAAEETTIQSWIRRSYRAHAGGFRRLSSTPLLSSGAFNAQHLVGCPLKFPWLCVAMADRISRFLANHSCRHPRGLAVSLRASPFAAAVCNVLDRKIDFDIVDHFGPRYGIVERTLIDHPTGADYLFFSDFLLGGTELKLAHNFAAQHNSRLICAVTFASLLEHTAYTDDLEVISFGLIRNIEPRARYRVY